MHVYCVHLYVEGRHICSTLFLIISFKQMTQVIYTRRDCIYFRNVVLDCVTWMHTEEAQVYDDTGQFQNCDDYPVSDVKKSFMGSWLKYQMLQMLLLTNTKRWTWSRTSFKSNHVLLKSCFLYSCWGRAVRGWIWPLTCNTLSWLHATMLFMHPVWLRITIPATKQGTRNTRHDIPWE